MLMNTHFQIAKSVLENMDEKKAILISEKNFVYGNVKPDAFSKYKLKKHYMEESFNMIIEKVKYLCSLTLESLSKVFSISRLSQELGVICHFLCDFFCVAHSERWEFKHSMNKHVIYERELAAKAKETDLVKIKGDGDIKEGEFESFFKTLYSQYKSNGNYIENDLRFSTYICNSVTDFVLGSILSNSNSNAYLNIA